MTVSTIDNQYINPLHNVELERIKFSLELLQSKCCQRVHSTLHTLQSMYFQCFKDLEGAKFFIILLKLHETIILFLFASHQMSNLNLDFELSSFGFLNECFYDFDFSIFLN